MTFARFSNWTLCIFCGFALFSGTVTAQDTLPQRNREAVDEVNARLSKEARGIPKDELTKVKPLFLAFAKYYADVVANPMVYKATLDPKGGPGAPRVPSIDRNNQTGILLELDRYILEPNLTTKVGNEKADYIRELGIAFDAVLKPLIETHAERIVRINAARILAEVCRSGATAHWSTVTALLTNENTLTEVKYYALHAAGNLLAAYDLNEYKSRKHSNDSKEVGALVQAITNCILNPSTILPGLKVAEATPDQLAVIGFVRRSAVRALAQLRFVTIPGPDGKQPLYPAYTLARVCVSDPVLVPAPSPGECAEAAIGLCNMAPSVDGNPVKGYNAATAVEAVAAGLKTFAGPRSDPADHSLPWRQYSIRISEALKNWRPLFDPTFEPTQPNNFDASAVPPAVNDAIERIKTLILVPIEKVDFNNKPDPNARVDIPEMERFLDQLRSNPQRKPLLFSNDPNTILYVPAIK
jgi:hypothetical protein